MELVIVLVSWLVVVSGQVTPKPTVISGVQFGLMETFEKTEGMVYHLEEDLSRKGFIMFSDGASLKTTNGVTTYTIVGNANTLGYTEGIGAAAQFGWITGFMQLNETHVVVVDYSNHCLRVVDRTKNLSSRFVGQCTAAGFQNGLEAYFHNPWSVIKDEKKYKEDNHTQLLVTDSKNQAVRFVDVEFKSVFTYLTAKNGLNLPYGITYDPRVENLFTTNYNYVMAHNSDDTNDIRVTGNFSEGYVDGKLEKAQFGVPAEIIALRNHLLLLADQNNNVLRLIDLKTSAVSTVCRNSSQFATVDGDVKTCQMDTPRGLLLTKDAIYVGQLRAIRKIPVRLPVDEIPPILPGTSLSGCSDASRTLQLTNGEKRVRVELVEGRYVFFLSAGEHELILNNENCTINVTVLPEYAEKGKGCPPEAINRTLAAGSDTLEIEIYPGEFLVYSEGFHQYRTPNCTTNITINAPPTVINRSNSTINCRSLQDLTLVVPDGEDTASYIENLDGITHTVQLPVGRHAARIHDGLEDCNRTITVIDYRLKRKLVFTATYPIECADFVNNNDTRDLVQTSAENKFIQIEDLCPRACTRNGTVDVECHSNKTTTINWPTDIVYSGNETTVPSDDLAKIRNSIDNSKSILDVIVLGKMPPVVFPTKPINASVGVFLEAFCLDNKSYNISTDSCN